MHPETQPHSSESIKSVSTIDVNYIRLLNTQVAVNWWFAYGLKLTRSVFTRQGLLLVAFICLWSFEYAKVSLEFGINSPWISYSKLPLCTVPWWFNLFIHYKNTKRKLFRKGVDRCAVGTCHNAILHAVTLPHIVVLMTIQKSFRFQLLLVVFLSESSLSSTSSSRLLVFTFSVLIILPKLFCNY